MNDHASKTSAPTSLRRVYEPNVGTIAYRREIRMIFQDPVGPLNPRMTVAQIVGELCR